MSWTLERNSRMPDSKVRRLLLFAYFYPPLGGPAVQRPCKTVKYLSEFGWETDVITTGGIVYHSTDETLLDECRHHRAIRTASLDPMYLLERLKKLLRIDTGRLYFGTGSARKSLIKKLFPIDDKIGWLPFALKAGRQALLTNRYHAVMVTCGPFSSALTARRIARKGKLPLILDYRDHWTLNNTTDQPSGFAFRCLQKLEQRLLRDADLVLTATDFMKQDLLRRFGAELEPKILPYYNGWDEADFRNMHRQRQADGKLRISYLGTLYGDRSLSFFLGALQQFGTEHPPADFELQMVGNFYPETHQEVESCGLKDKVTFIPQQSHASAIQMMLDSDILLLVIGDAKNKWILTGKLFEYLRSQRPILALTAPDSEAAGILRSCGQNAICPIDDIPAIKDCLANLQDGIAKGNTLYKIPEQYERSLQVKNLLDAITGLGVLSD